MQIGELHVAFPPLNLRKEEWSIEEDQFLVRHFVLKKTPLRQAAPRSSGLTIKNIFQLTCWVCGTNPSNLERGRAETRRTALEATQGHMDGFFGQLPYKCHLEEVVSVGD
jgi:hypothetical protein